jgi:hypothetical protein
VAARRLRSRASRPQAAELVRSAASSALEPLEGRVLMTVNPVIVYNFDESGDPRTVIDSSADGGVQNGTLTLDNAPARVADGQAGSASALEFYGSGALSTEDEGRLDTVALEGILGHSGTISTWIKTTQVGGANPWESPGIAGMEDGAGGNDIFWGFIDDRGRLGIQAGDAASARTTTPINDGAWHQVTLTRDETSGLVRIYLDGQINASAVSGTGAKTLPFNSIGALPNYSGPDAGGVRTNNGSRYFNGDLDQLQIFDRALGAQEVAQRFGPTAATAPVAPTVTTVAYPFEATLNFTNVSGEQGYQVLRSPTGAAGSYAEVAVLPADSTSYTATGLARNTQYFYQVVAFNGAGSSAPASATFTTPLQGVGSTKAYYYNDQYWNSANVRADTPPGLAIGPNPAVNTIAGAVNYDWGDGTNGTPGSPAPGTIRNDNFSTVFTGKLRAPETGTYTILGFSDDDSYVWVNGQLVSGDPGGHGIPTNDATGIGQIEIKNAIDLVAGQEYDLVAVQSEGGGGAGLILRWITPTDTSPDDATTIPASAYNSVTSTPAAPSDLVESFHTTNSVDFTFADNATSELRYVLERSQNNFATSTPVATVGIQSPQLGGPTVRDATALPGQTYQYRVRAVNFEGSAVSNAVTVTTDAAVVEAGAQGYYFNDQWWKAGAPTNTNGTGVTVGRAFDASSNVQDVNENWGNGSPDASIRPDNFSTVFTGTIHTTEAGLYTILGFSDDDSYVWVNGQLVSADPGGHGIPGTDAAGLAAIDVKNPITLAANTDYNFVAVQSEGGGGAGLILRWVTPSSGGVVDIPVEAYTSNIPNAAGGTATGAPVAPTAAGSSGVDLGDKDVILRWTDNATNELRYTVERSTDATFATNVSRFDAPINATSFTDTGLAANTTYFYRVVASNFNGESPAATATVTTRATDLAPTAAPSNLRGSARAGGATRLVFLDNSTNEDQFIIERRDANGGTFAEVGRRNGTTFGTSGATLTFDDTTAVTGTTYVYRVSASNTGGVSAPSNEFTLKAGGQGGSGLRGTVYDNGDFTGATVVKTFDADEDFGNNSPDPAIGPDDFTIVMQGEVQAEYSEPYTFFTASDDGIAIRVYDATTDQLLINYDNLGAARGLPAAGTFSDNAGTANLVAGHRYRIEVAHREQGGGAGYRFGWSSPSTPQEVIPTDLLFPATSTEVGLAPTQVQAYAVGNEQVNVFFRDVNFSETGYTLERSTNATSGFTEVATVTGGARTFGDVEAIDRTPVTLGTTYYYRLRSTGATSAANSPYSQVVSVTPAVNGTDLTVNGNAVVLPGADGNATTGADNTLQITPALNDQRGSAFLTNARNLEAAGQGTDGSNGFRTGFDFSIPAGSDVPADGFVFLIQRQRPNALGGGGGAMGYVGVPDSLAVKFDLYPAADNANPGVNETGLYANGAIDDNGTDTGLVFASGDRFHVDLSYNADTDTLTQTITDLDDANATPFSIEYTNATAPNGAFPGLNLADLIGGTNAFVGFAGATGGLNAAQVISNWTFNGQAVPLVGNTSGPSIVHVSQVFVGGRDLNGGTPNGGATAFRNAAGTAGNFGYPVPAGAAQSRSLPWINGVNQVAIRFDQDVSGQIDQNDLVVTGSSSTYSFAPGGFSYDPTTRTAVWTLAQPVTQDRLRIVLNGVSGLDGEWVNPSTASPNGDAYPSGDGTAGGDFNFRINVLAGDATGDQRVDALDLADVKRRLGRRPGDGVTGGAAYSVFADLTADGIVNALDLAAVKQRLGRRLGAEPAGAAAVAAASFASTGTTASITRDVFAS